MTMTVLNSIRAWLAPPVFEGDEEKTRVASLLNTVLLFLYATPVVLAADMIFTPANARPLALPLIALLPAALSAMVYFMHRGYVRAVSLVTVSFVLLSIAFLAYLGGGEARPLNIYYTLVIVMAALLLGGRGAMVSAIATAVVVGVVTVTGAAGLITSQTQAPSPATSLLIYAAGFLLIGVVLRLASNSLGTALELARRSRSELQVLASTLERHVIDIAMLKEMGDLLQACLTSDEAYAVIARMARQLFPAEDGALYILNDARNLVEAVAVWGAVLPDQPTFMPADCLGLQSGHLKLVERETTAAACGTGSHPLPACHHVQPPKLVAYVCAPLVAQGNAFGVFHLRCGRETGQTSPSKVPGQWFTGAKLQLVQTVVDSLVMALGNVKLRETLRQQSIHDEVTGLFNRRYMEEMLERELQRATRAKCPVGIIMLDVDHFKKINDTFGHEAGDIVLREIGECLLTQIREEDIACRFGGEEFTLIMPTASPAVTQQRAEQLREKMKRLTVQFHGQTLGPITVSQGVAAFPGHGASIQTLLRTADTALYRAKLEGRDRVVVAG
jgi:diguanylate cyclase (GGDEF)-like protein